VEDINPIKNNADKGSTPKAKTPKAKIAAPAEATDNAQESTVTPAKTKKPRAPKAAGGNA
jgi:hypothetical protein